MIHVWSVLCRRSLIDRDTNTVSLIDTVEALTLAPVQTPQGAAMVVLPLEMEMVTLWTRSEESVGEFGRHRLRILLPDQAEQILEPGADIDLREYHRLRARTRVTGLPIKGPGRYWFVVEYAKDEEDWTEMHRVPLDISIPVGST